MKVSGKSEMVCCFFNVRLLWIWGVKGVIQKSGVAVYYMKRRLVFIWRKNIRKHIMVL